MTAGLALAFAAISRTSGAGWANVIVALLTGALAVGFFGPGLALLRSDVDVVVPTDATAGLPIPLQLDGTTGLVAEILALGTGRFLTSPGQLITRAPRRGVIDHVMVELRSSAPLGFVEWRRRIDVTFDAPLEVGPLPIMAPLPHRDHSGAIDGVEVSRGVREYRPGDSMKHIHWPASARLGDLVVRELETPVDCDIVLIVHLTGDDANDDAITGRAAGLAFAALTEGYRVTLETDEVSGHVRGVTTNRLDVSRRLARATVGLSRR